MEPMSPDTPLEITPVSLEELLQAFIELLPRSRAVTKMGRTKDDLAVLYTAFPAGTPRLPHLYEQLILSWAWIRGEPFDHELMIAVPRRDYPLRYTLLGNPLGKTSFAPLLREMKRDAILWERLSKARFIPFGQGGFQSYDPICFDLNRVRGNDCPIVGIDHEEILCFDRVRIAGEIAPSFRELVMRTQSK